MKFLRVALVLLAGKREGLARTIRPWGPLGLTAPLFTGIGLGTGVRGGVLDQGVADAPAMMFQTCPWFGLMYTPLPRKAA